MSRITRIVSTSFIAALAACGATGPYGGGGGGGGGSGNQNPPPANTINASPNLVFSPGTLTINSGETVTYAFGSVAHNVVFDGRNEATPSDILSNNANVSVQRTFGTAGTYSYHCNIHPEMTGAVVVR